ncbi:MAG: hypothetical protein U9O64_08415, partial [Campylobacterota bacterium]|nr:hypothetical protein [Campylobacterota bacterium]
DKPLPDLIFSANSSTSISIFICLSFYVQFYLIDTELFTVPLFAAMMQLILRLPLTSGYVNGGAFLFTWIAAYFPQLIWVLICSTLIVVLNASQKISKSKTYIISILGIYSILSWLVIIPSINNLTAGLLVFFTPANPQDILLPPYDLTTTIIASLSFVEPTIAYFIIGLLVWDNNSKNKVIEAIKLIFVIMVISQSLVRHIAFVLNSDLPFVAANLSVGQFTLEWIFVGIMISFLLPWYHKKANE